MTHLRNSISPWLAALSSLMLIGACASSATNSPKPKSLSDESATGPEDSSTSAKSSATTKGDAAEDETEEAATPAKAKESAGEAKEKAGKAPVDDSRTTEAIHKIIKENRKTFKKCYEDERKKAPDLKGTVLLKLTLDAEGKIKSVGIDPDETTIKVKAVSDCIIKVAQTLTYPPSSKGLDKDFQYKFGFNNLE
jgi:hypothetical protein